MERRTGALRFLYLTLSFLLPAAILSVVLAANGIFPFGEKSILIYDLRSQYADFFAFLRNGGNIFYSFQRAFGGDSFSLTAYYLMSPFHLLLLLPVDIISAITVIYYLKIMTASLTLFCYLQKTHLFALDSKFTPLLAAAYTFCGFPVMYAQNIMWLDAMWLLPLVAWASEILVSDGRSKGFAVMTAASLIINFYMGFMITVFSFVYILFLQMSMEHDGRGRTFMRAATTAVCGLGLSGVVLYTVYHKLALTKMSEDNLLMSFGKITDFLDRLFFAALAAAAVCAVLLLFDKQKNIVRKGAFRSRPAIIVAGISAVFFTVFIVKDPGRFAASAKKIMPFVYDLDSGQLYCSSVCVILFLMLVVFWIKDRTVKAPHFIALLLWVLLPVVWPGFDLFLHSGQEPISFPTRYSFIISFVFIMGAAYSLSLVKFDLLRGTVPAVVVSLVSLTVITEPALNAFFAFRYNEKEYYGYYPKDSYNSYIAVNADALKQAGLARLTRTEKTYYRSLNDSMALGYHGLSHYSSMYRRSFITDMRRLGYAASEYWSSYFGSTPLLDSLFGIEYLLDMTDLEYASQMLVKRTGKSYVSDLYEKTASTCAVDIYRNPCILPVAFAADSAFASAVIDGKNPFERQNSLVSVLTGKKEAPFIAQRSTGPEFRETESFRMGTTVKKTSAFCSLTVSTDGTLYIYIPPDGHIPCNIYVNGTLYAEYMTSQAGIAYTVYLGSYRKGSELEIWLEPNGTEIGFSEAVFYVLSKDYPAAVSSLQEGAAEISFFSQNRLKCKTARGGLLFTSIPYEEGWHVAGNAGVIVESNGFLCVQCGEDDGVNDVELVYVPPGLQRGCILSAAGLVLLFCIIIKEKKEHGILKNAGIGP